MNVLKEKILLYAEDEFEIQKQYRQYFENYFQTVLTASDGQEAFGIYHEQKPDVLILDINMPLLNGLEVAKKVRMSGDDVCIILLTARGDIETLKEAIELGVLTYLEKPILRDDLKKALQKLADKIQKKSIKKLWFYEKSYYVWDAEKRQLSYKEKQILLTRQEMALLKLLISTNGIKTSYQDIYETVWYDDFTKDYNESTIKSLLSGLRAKLPPKAIKNAYGMGYFLNIY